MLTPMRTCPLCHTRVLPAANGTCPACRRDMAGATAEARPGSSDGRPRGKIQLYDAAVLHWRLLGLVAVQIGLGVFTWGVRHFWPRGMTSAAEQREWTLELLYLALLVGAVLIAVHLYRLARWLGHSAPLLWALAVAVPCAGPIAVLLVTKEAASEFEERGLRIYLLGPRLRDIPRRQQSPEPEELQGVQQGDGADERRPG